MVTIQANQPWNETPFQLEKGKQYRFTSTGTWMDAETRCDATGYSSWKLVAFGMFKRMPSARWFSLIGAIDKDPSTQFDIGGLIEKNQVYTATATGTLHCYANDASFMYWNNEGAVDLEVQPVET